MFSCELDRYLELFTGLVWSSLLLLVSLPYQPCVCELLNCSAVSSSASTSQLSLLGLAFGPTVQLATPVGFEWSCLPYYFVFEHLIPSWWGCFGDVYGDAGLLEDVCYWRWPLRF